MTRSTLSSTTPSFTAIEALESRIAPASVLLLDKDGDHIKFTSAGPLLSGLITVDTATDAHHNIYEVNMSDGAFAGKGLTVTVIKGPHGDGQAVVGSIDGGTNNFGTIKIAGDLGEISAGDGTTSGGIKALIVNSIGRFDERGTGSYSSLIDGNLGSLMVKGNIVASYVRVSFSLLSAHVGGSIIGGDGPDAGEIYAFSLGNVTILGDIRGGDGGYSGSVGAGSDATSVSVHGSLIGADGDNSGNIYGAYYQDGKISNVNVFGSVVGGSGDNSGIVGGGASGGGTFHVALGKVSVGRDLIGAAGQESGEVWAYLDAFDSVVIKGSIIGSTGTDSGQVYATKHSGSLMVFGSLYGGNGQSSGGVHAVGGLDSVTVKGSLYGGVGGTSGTLEASGTVGSAVVGHDLHGDSGNYSGSILGPFTTVTVHGGLAPGSGTPSGAIVP